MIITIFAVVLIIVLLLGIPVVFGLGFTSVFVIALQRGLADIPFEAIAQRLIYGINNFPTLAIPCFLLVGRLMSSSRRRFMACTVLRKASSFSASEPSTSDGSG